MKAYIKKAKGEGLWLFIDKYGIKGESVKQILDTLQIEEGNVAWAVKEEEVPLILEACKKWLEGKK